jgi:hypothetical protein
MLHPNTSIQIVTSVVFVPVLIQMRRKMNEFNSILVDGVIPVHILLLTPEL